MSDARTVFDRSALARICTMPERKFARAFDLGRHTVGQPAPDNFYLYRDNGSSVLAVAHLDTVGRAHERGAHFSQTEAGLVVHSRALDDRLGAYIILDMLPNLGIEFDVLLTVGEESGRSTAAFFETPKGKQYDWMIEFDRGGTDVVMYQYDDDDSRAAVKACGAVVGDGIFSDISYLDHVGVKGFNWGVGYRDYHGPRAHAYLEDTFDMVDHFQVFNAQNADVRMPYDDLGGGGWFGSRFYGSSLSRYDWDATDGNDLPSGWLGEDLRDYDMPDDWDERDPFFVADNGRPMALDRKAS